MPSDQVDGPPDFRFDRSELARPRPEGISAFLRTRNGEAFVERVIRTHIEHFDEIVAVHNRCTDRTPKILGRLAQEFGSKLRVFAYDPPVFPQGSEGHKSEPAESPRSVVNYSNFALARTRFATVVKLDDDHLAMEDRLATMVADLRSGKFHDDTMVCFSGINLDRGDDGRLGIPPREVFSGSGDIGFFRASPETFFEHDPRFERFRRGNLKRVFGDILYWHLKYLKPGQGFANYDLDENPESRYAKRLLTVTNDRRVVAVSDLSRAVSLSDRLEMLANRLGVPLTEKAALRAGRWRAALQLAKSAGLPDEASLRPAS